MPVGQQTKKPAVKQTEKPQAAAAASEEKVQSKADLFDSAKPQGLVAPGKYEALLVEAVLQDAAENGTQSVRMNYEIADEGDFRGNRVVQFYNIFQEGSTEEKAIPGRGIEFLKKDLVILGYADVAFEDIENVLTELAEKKPGVVITGKQNGQYFNIYLNGLAEGSDQIEAYRESRGF